MTAERSWTPVSQRAATKLWRRRQIETYRRNSEEFCLTGRVTATLTQAPAGHFFPLTSRANFFARVLQCRDGEQGVDVTGVDFTGVPVATVANVDQTGVRGAETKAARLSSAIRPECGWQSSALGSLIGSCASPPPPFPDVGRQAYRSIYWDAILFEGRISHRIVSSPIIVASKSQPLYFWRACWRPVGFVFFFFPSRSTASQRCRCVRVIRPAGFCRAHKSAPSLMPVI